MRETSDDFFSICADADLHENTFRVIHYKGNEHLDLTIRHDRHGFRTLHLGLHNCRELGTRLLRFCRTRQLNEPRGVDDWSI